MGFAVVAKEVRNLAGRSAQAAKDTTVMIETNIALSTNGISVAEKVKAALNEITNHAKKVYKLMGEISLASQEQSQGLERINKAMTQMEVVTQQNASSAEETASSSETLKDQAQNLRETIIKLSALINIQSKQEVRMDSNHHLQTFSQNQPEAMAKPSMLPHLDQEKRSPIKGGYQSRVIATDEAISLEKIIRFNILPAVTRLKKVLVNQSP